MKVAPLYPVTLPTAERRAAQIPDDAEHFAFVYPFKADWTSAPADMDKTSADVSFLTIGGFVYFDASLAAIRGTTLSIGGEGGLQFGPPKPWLGRWTQALTEQGMHFHPVTLEEVAQGGAEKFAWIPPQMCIDGEKGSVCPHGGFAYLCPKICIEEICVSDSKVSSQADKFEPEPRAGFFAAVGRTLGLIARAARRPAAVQQADSQGVAPGWDSEAEVEVPITIESEMYASVITPRPSSWDSKVQAILQSGRDDVFLVMDFDRTITKCFIEDGSRGADSHDILGSHSKISWSCKRMMELLMEKFYPIETDPNLAQDTKAESMVEWYSLVNSLIAQQGITRDDVAQAVAECKDFRLRDGVEEIFQLANTANIPIIVLSAGLGNVIEEVVKQCIRKPSGELGEEWENVRVLSNTLLWDADGKHAGFSEPILHPFNKSMKDAPAQLHEFIAGRNNAIIMGDGLGDLTMADGTQAKEVLKFGFLNERIDERLTRYTALGAWDRIVLNDESFDGILGVCKTLCTVNPSHILALPRTAHPCITPNPTQWARKVKHLLDAGKDKMFIVIDFDRTITKCFLENGDKCLDSHDTMASIPKVTWQCKKTMEILMDRYYPIETDPHMSNKEKTVHMVEWYSLVNALLEAQGILQSDVATAVAECKDFRLRSGVGELFRFAYSAGIPVIILSAGLGNIIDEVVKQCIHKPSGAVGEAWENIRSFSNTLQWDGGAKARFSEPILHPFCKSLKDAPEDIKNLIGDRHVAVLAGDSMGDLTMADGVETSEVLKIGFLNERVDERLTQYTGEGGFDRVVLNDGGFDPLLEVLRRVQ
jgi:5'-nucleotidase